MSNSAIHEQGAFDVSLLEASFAAIAPEAERLVASFYEELFKRDSSIRSVHASTDMSSQKPKLLAALKLVIANVRNPDVLLPALREMGQRHESYGVTPAHYSLFTDVLLDVLADIVGDKWTEQEQNAWTGALTMVAETMISAYQQIRNILDEHKGKINHRTAAFINAIDKIATSYADLGIFP